MASKLCKRDGGLSLPEDIVFELLVRLSAKVLCRFRCVCKAWRALIADHAFVAAQRSRAGPLIVALFRYKKTKQHQLRLMDKNGDVLSLFEVRAPALLVQTRLDLIFIDRKHLGALIINPARGRDFTVIDTNDCPPPPWWAPTSTLDPVCIDHSLGRTTASGDYKVLRLVTSSHWHVPRNWCEVTTVMDGDGQLTWRQRPWGPFNDTWFSYEDKATVNGVLYFMVDNTYPASDGRKHIAAFDLESEEWKPTKIKRPLLRHKNRDDKWQITLTELKGTLCMVDNVQYLADLAGHYADIWLLKDPNRSVWVKEYRIQMYKRLLSSTEPLNVLADGTLLLLNTIRKADGDNHFILQLYNSSTKAFIDYMEMAEGFDGAMAFYTGSLLY